MAFKFSNKIQNLNDAMFPSPNKGNANLMSAFGGESVGFSRETMDLKSAQFYTTSELPSADTVPKGVGNKKIRTAIGNKYALFNFQGFHGNLQTAQGEHYIDSPKNPLMGGANAKTVSIPKIIDYYDQNFGGKLAYKPADFLYGKYYKKIPVNHLITLRRFATPIPDNIYNYNIRPKGTQEESVDSTHVAGVTAVTYLGETAGNKLSDLLKFNYGLNYKKLEAEMEAIDSGDAGGGYTKQPFYKKLGGIGQATADAAKGVSAGAKFRAENGGGSSTADRLGTTYANFVLGPINVIDETQVRDRGIKFSNDMKLQFEYELKSLSYVNPKIAMIDIMSNMLAMTTNNAQFFGGGHRYYGSAGFVASQFGDASKLRNGDFAGYMGSVVTDVETGMKGLFGNSAAEGGGFSASSIIDGLKKVGTTMLGNMLGGFLGSQVGGATGTAATKAFIDGGPTGDWHVTVGNPLNPIVMMGNMICDNTVMTLGEGLGYDDFPMEVKFEIDVKHGKPRDKGDIENMFNAGNGRIYASAQETKDFLPDEGAYTRGSIQTGSVSLQNTQSFNGASPEQAKGNAGSKKSTKAANMSVSGEYVSNLTQFIIDS
tara:strand:- start:3540 stop:5333 length:1794 start_codon:yes stop_codon:yes gene_type:complete